MKIDGIVGVILGIIIFLIMIPYISMEECTPCNTTVYEDTYTIVGTGGVFTTDVQELINFLEYHTHVLSYELTIYNTSDPLTTFTAYGYWYSFTDNRYEIQISGSVIIDFDILSNSVHVDPYEAFPGLNNVNGTIVITATPV